MKSDSMIMKSLLKTILVIFCSLGIVACADKSQSVKLVPDIPVVESNQGNGKMLTVKVVDKRPNSVVGYRTSSSMATGGEITLSQSLEKLVLYESIKGLMKKGFNPLVCKPDDSPDLKIEIEAFKYYTSTSQWTGAIHTSATIRAIVTLHDANQTKRFYENSYTVSNEKKNVVVATASQNEKFINEMLNDVMKKLLDDNQLLEFMGKWAQ